MGAAAYFYESQKEGNNEIWIDVYPLTRFLAAAAKVEGTKEWVRTADIVNPRVEEYEAGTLGEMQMPAKEDSLENNQLEGQEEE